MCVGRARRQTRRRTRPLSEVGDGTMRTVLSRSAQADQLEAEVRDATCCSAIDRCWSCEVKLGEVRATRRDAPLHSISTVLPRRTV
jgi:hypothetical protein